MAVSNNINITKTNLESIQPFRVMFLHENNFQFIYDKCHYYGWAEDWMFTINDVIIGYGSLWGIDEKKVRESIFEFFLLPPYRKIAAAVFSNFITATGAVKIDSQSNDLLLSDMLYTFSESIVPDAILFEEDITTNLAIPGVNFSRKKIEDDNPAHFGGFVLESNGEELADGGFLTNYNKPYADIYMEVREAHRGKGYGSLIVQELKKEVYKIGRVPAARCNANNHISKATLIKAGFKVCGAMLTGKIRV